jgi:hypothetical protein
VMSCITYAERQVVGLIVDSEIGLSTRNANTRVFINKTGDNSDGINSECLSVIMVKTLSTVALSTCKPVDSWSLG